MQTTNLSQQKAINHDEGHLLIVAGPGTGKTYTLTLRIARLSKPIKITEKILAVTFTNKAARQMNERVAILGLNSHEKIEIGTFHGFCLRFLRENSMYRFTLVAGTEINEQVQVLWKDKNHKQIKETLRNISFWKSTQFHENEPEDVVLYNEFLRAQGYFDYDDLLVETINLLKKDKGLLKKTRQKYPFIFIDEYQDINPAQNALLKILTGDTGIVTAIGDPCQAIYGFRGSDVKFFNDFSRDFKGATVVNLSDNYRSAPNLLEAASQVIEKQVEIPIPGLIAKIYEQGELVVYEAPTDKAEAEYVVHSIEKIIGGTSMFSHDSRRARLNQEGTHSFSDIAVLYRLNSQNRLLNEAFLRSGMPFKVSGEKSLLEEEGISEFINSLKEVKGTSSDSAKELIEKTMKDSSWASRVENDQVFKQRIDRLKMIAIRTHDFEGFLDGVILQRPEDGGQEGGEKVSLMTLHSSKGLEFPVVFIVGCEEGLIPYERNENKDEERRLFYVGMTRAKEKLILVASKKRMMFGKSIVRKESGFLSDIQEKLKRYEEIKKQKVKKRSSERQIDLFG